MGIILRHLVKIIKPIIITVRSRKLDKTFTIFMPNCDVVFISGGSVGHLPYRILFSYHMGSFYGHTFNTVTLVMPYLIHLLQPDKLFFFLRTLDILMVHTTLTRVAISIARAAKTDLATKGMCLAPGLQN